MALEVRDLARPRQAPRKTNHHATTEVAMEERDLARPRQIPRKT